VHPQPADFNDHQHAIARQYTISIATIAPFLD